MARAGPEPSTPYFLPASSPDRLQPAYCEPRQASTGWDVCTVTMKGHALSVSVVSSATLPSPPRQISAMRRPASSPPRARTPQSMRHSPSEPCVTSTRSASASAISALTSGAARALTLGHAFCRAAAISSLLFNVFPPANALNYRKYFANSLLDQAPRLCSCATARPHSAYRAVFVDPFRRLRPIGGPVGPDGAGRYGESCRGIDDCRSHGIIEFESACGKPPLA